MFDLEDAAFVRLSALDYALRFDENVASIVEAPSKPAAMGKEDSDVLY